MPRGRICALRSVVSSRRARSLTARPSGTTAQSAGGGPRAGSSSRRSGDGKPRRRCWSTCASCGRSSHRKPPQRVERCGGFCSAEGLQQTESLLQTGRPPPGRQPPGTLLRAPAYMHEGREIVLLGDRGRHLRGISDGLAHPPPRDHPGTGHGAGCVDDLHTLGERELAHLQRAPPAQHLREHRVLVLGRCEVRQPQRAPGLCPDHVPAHAVRPPRFTAGVLDRLTVARPRTPARTERNNGPVHRVVGVHDPARQRADASGAAIITFSHVLPPSSEIVSVRMLCSADDTVFIVRLGEAEAWISLRHGPLARARACRDVVAYGAPADLSLEPEIDRENVIVNIETYPHRVHRSPSSSQRSSRRRALTFSSSSRALAPSPNLPAGVAYSFHRFSCSAYQSCTTSLVVPCRTGAHTVTTRRSGPATTSTDASPCAVGTSTRYASLTVRPPAHVG